jgi:sulfatase modifying factor 1
MKRVTWILLAGVVIAASCTPASTPTAPPPPPTIAPVEPSPTSAPAPSQAPTLAPAALAGPQSATSMVWLDGSVLVYVPAGSFTMGTGITSTPEKTVDLDGFWIYQTDVTNKMYAQCVATGNCAPPAQEVGAPVYSNPGFGDYPVVGVTWDMAANYCKWAQGQLPTEAQWEMAARGESGFTYPWGIDPPSCSLANFQGCLGHSNAATDYESGRSPYGVLGMVGNVFQWVNDFYDEHYYDNMPPRNPTGPTSGAFHVLRGSSYETASSLLAAGVRHFGAVAFHSGELGFRCSVPQPKALAPYCQTNSYIPTGAGSTSATCQLPQIGLQRNYCTAQVGFATVVIPTGASWHSNNKSYSCTEAVVDGQRVLTCTGPDNSSGKVTVCNTACSGAPSDTGAPVVCDPGYQLDASSHACIYAPVSLQPAVAGCPDGYNLVQRAGQKLCAVGRNQNGLCPAATYFDGQYGACVSPAADAPYGVNDPASGSQAYQGCAAGYAYDNTNQCCQAKTGGAYPGCPVGSIFDAAQSTCVPQQVQVSGPGCLSVSLNIARCTPIVDVCSNIPDERSCIRNPLCAWDDKKGLCLMQKRVP